VRPAPGGTIRIGVAEVRSSDADPRGPDALLERATAAALLTVDGAGRLAPGALSEVPLPEADGRAFRLRVRPGLADAQGRPLGAADVAARLTSLLARGPTSAEAWVALPILGADAVLEGRAPLLAGLEVLGPHELLVTLAFPLPELPWLLATPAAALPGAGPFSLVREGSPPRPRPGAVGSAPAVLARNDGHHRGRPYADRVELHAVDARGAARLLERGALDLVLRPEPAGGRPGPELPALAATVAAVNAGRLGAGAPATRRALRALDRAELARRFVRGRGAPLSSIVPAAILPGDARPAAEDDAGGPAPPRLSILADGAAADQRALAERIQVKLFDRGVRAAVELADGARLRARLLAGEYDVALVHVPVLAPAPALAAGQIAFAARGPAAARRAMEALAGKRGEEALAAAGAIARELDLVPLVASAPRASLGPALQGLAPGADGGVCLGDLWLLGAGAPAGAPPAVPPGGGRP
jgi:peptide/nickel transport system substrate-binding protein